MRKQGESGSTAGYFGESSGRFERFTTSGGDAERLPSRQQSNTSRSPGRAARNLL